MASIIIKFVLIHLTVGGIRGGYRYFMIKKYQYNYYHHSMKIVGRLAHNWLYGTFNSTTLLISVFLSVLIFLTL